MSEYEGPDIVMLWDKKPTARCRHLCDHCNEEISPGTKYESVGYTEDGEFKAEKRHLYAYSDPSGCPKYHERDLARLKVEAERDAEFFNPSAARTAVKESSPNGE